MRTAIIGLLLLSSSSALAKGEVRAHCEALFPDDAISQVQCIADNLEAMKSIFAVTGMDPEQTPPHILQFFKDCMEAWPGAMPGTYDFPMVNECLYALIDEHDRSVDPIFKED